MKELTNPSDYFPYIGHNIHHEKQARLSIFKNAVGDLYKKGKIVQVTEDKVTVTATNRNSMIRHQEINGLKRQRQIAADPEASCIVVPRHRTLSDYTIGQPIHHELINPEVMVLAGNNLFVSHYDRVLRVYGGIMFLREDAILKKRGYPKVFLSQKNYLTNVFPAYLRQQMIDGVEEQGHIVRRDMIMYPEQEKHPVTKKRSGGRTKTGQLRNLSHILFDRIKEITKDTEVKLYITPVNISLSKVPEVPYIVHPVVAKGLKRALRYMDEQLFVYSSYTRYARKHEDARLEIVANYGKPELFSFDDFQSMRDIMRYSMDLRYQIGLLESIFPLPFLSRVLNQEAELSREECEQRALKLFEHYNSLGIHIDKISDSRGNMMPVDEIIERSIRTINANPVIRIKEVNEKKILSFEKGRLYCHDNNIKEWYANNIRHLDKEEGSKDN